jgi:SAM-dependent methyltransferase
MKPDFGNTSTDYAKHRAGFPSSFFVRLRERGLGLGRQRILDLGTGTGTLARGFASAGAKVTGLDVSAAQVEAAKALDTAAGVAIDYVVGKAEATGLPAASFEVVIAGQCWHWFDSLAAMAESARLLSMNGHLVICHFDWLPLPGNMVEATERLIEAHNPSWKMGGGNGFHDGWARDATRAGFRHVETFSYDHDQPYTHEAWRGRIRASAGVGGTLSPAGVAKFDTDLADLLRTRFPGEPLRVPHRVFAMIATRPAEPTSAH